MELLKTITVVVFFTLAGTNVGYAQFDVEGKVSDTSDVHQVSLEASVVVLRKADSVLITFGRSGKDGKFTFRNLKPDHYILLVTHPRYLDYVEPFVLGPDSKNMFYDIKLTGKSIMLEEVSVMYRKQAAMRQNGDTLEFAADRFKVRPNASLEELLKKLPGLQIDRSGRITTQGKSIDKVLVDGEEFFSDDPTLVTRNLKANMVETVQLYERSSDQAAFTGIKDGSKNKTLNIKLKPEGKEGYFGKVEIGAGNKGFYQNQVMFNAFQQERKIAAYFILSNTEKIGLDRRSQQSYAGGDSNPIGNDLDNWNGTYDGVGIPKSFSGGLHFNDKWNDSRESLNGNYKIIGLDVNGTQSGLTQTNLPGNILYSSTEQKFKNHLLRNGVNMVYTFKIDPSSDFKVDAEGSLMTKSTARKDLSDTRGQNNSRINNSVRDISTDGNTKAFSGNFLWRKKLNKERRTISFGLDVKMNNSASTGDFSTVNSFFNDLGLANGIESVDQYKTSDNNDESYHLRTTYTEPLGKWDALVFNYGILIDRAKSFVGTFNKLNGSHDNLRFDSLYSANYRFNQNSHRGGVNYLYTRQKLMLQMGGDVSANQFNQKDLFTNTLLKRSFVNWFPNALLRYQFSASQSLNFSYNGNTIQPNIRQLQPLVNNEDLLNVFTGNTLLDPAFSNTFNSTYQFIKNNVYLTIDANFSVTTKPITLSVLTDASLGKSTYTYVNLDGHTTSNYGSNFLFRNKLKSADLDYGFDGGLSVAKYVNLSNGLINNSRASIYKFNTLLSKSKDSVYNIGISLGVSYNVNKASLQPRIDNNFWGYQTNPYAEFFLPGKFELHTDGSYLWQGKTETFNTNFSRFIWNASLEKQFLKNNNLKFKLTVNDILNQNIGFSRRVYDNSIVQNAYSNIARYFLVSIIWDFNHAGKKEH